MNCVLCEALKEKGIYEDKHIKILETKSRKGHLRRIMAISKHHTKRHSWDDHMITMLEQIGKEVFHYTYKFAIMSPLFGTVKNHAHFVASDLDPNSQDFFQVLGTPWERVVQVKLWKEVI